MTERHAGSLELADGTIYQGTLYGHADAVEGEVVFTTAMTGYGEIATDASYAGQIVILTFPMIGIYGVDPGALEAERPHARALVVRELSPIVSHHTAQLSLDDYLDRFGVPVLSGIDTRALTRRIRRAGTMAGRIARATRGAVGQVSCQLVEEVATGEPYWFADGGEGPTVAVVDFGCKDEILRQLRDCGARVVVLPPTAKPAQVAEHGAAGVVLSNGPGDPAQMPAFAASVRAIADRYPTLGICLGHQLLALGYGASTFKLPFGHRGANHPVGDGDGQPATVTSQNHGYAVDARSVAGTDLEVTQVHLNDGTVEALRHRRLPVESVQYHPEAGPGPWDARGTFGRFVDTLKEATNA